MIVRDVLRSVPEERVIARAIFEDRCELKDINGWITKYYAQLIKLKSSKVRKSDMMLYMSVVKDDRDNISHAHVSGFTYADIKAGKEIYYGIEYSNYTQYASLYVPDYTVERYGEEIVASEALREYGWNDFDAGIVCSDAMRVKVLQSFEDMKHELIPIDRKYYVRCTQQFLKAYEGK